MIDCDDTYNVSYSSKNVLISLTYILKPCTLHIRLVARKLDQFTECDVILKYT